MPIDEARWASTNAYAREVFGREPDHIRANRQDAEEAGLPSWAVTPEVGRLLALLVATTAGRCGLEIGTLGGYSTLWLLEGMRPDARIITLEHVDRHADFAEQEFARHGVGQHVEVRRGAALDLLPAIVQQLGPESLDVVFIDADKASYPDYYEATAGLVAPGGLLLADNIFGTSDSWIDDLTHPDSAATDRMNRRAAADDRFDTAGVFVRAGLLVARRRQRP
ncbi:MAG: O-methyltransferase [Chloroflexota bacterium]|jgi:predicted O-methyltransferase YrrM